MSTEACLAYGLLYTIAYTPLPLNTKVNWVAKISQEVFTVYLITCIFYP